MWLLFYSNGYLVLHSLALMVEGLSAYPATSRLALCFQFRDLPRHWCLLVTASDSELVNLYAQLLLKLS